MLVKGMNGKAKGIDFYASGSLKESIAILAMFIERTSKERLLWGDTDTTVSTYMMVHVIKTRA